MSLPSPIALRKCPFCGYIFKSNTDGGFIHMTLGMTWTDGDQSDNVCLTESELVNCQCSKIYRIEEAQLVGLDMLEYPVKDGLMCGRPVEEAFIYLKSDLLKEFKGSSLRHNTYDHYLALPGFPDDYNVLEIYGHGKPSPDVVLKNKLYTTPEEELETRIRLFWSEKNTTNFNKYKNTAIKPLDECTSDDNDLLRGYVLSDKAVENIIKLLELWDTLPKYNSGNLAYLIMKADMHRQLGRFEDCTLMLNSFKNNEIFPSGKNYTATDEYATIINLMHQSCKEKIRCPRKLILEDIKYWW